MAGSSSGYQDENAAISDINVTPLVDVVLVLLVIFMVVAPMIAARGIPVDTPKTSSGESVESPLKLTLTAEGVLFVNDSRYAADDRLSAGAEIAGFVRDNPELRVIIDADQAAPHGDVMEVVDLVKRANIEKIAFSTVPRRIEIEDGAGAD